MKKILALTTLAAALLAACSGGKSNVFVVSGYVPVINDSTVVSLFRSGGSGALSEIGGDTVINGKFRLEVPMEEGVERLMLVVKVKNLPMHLPIYGKQGGKAKVAGNDMNIATWEVKSNVKEQQTYNKLVGNSREERIEQQQAITDMYKAMMAGEDYMSFEKKSDSLQFCISKRDVEMLRQLPVDYAVLMEVLDQSELSCSYDNYPYQEELKEIEGRLAEKADEYPEMIEEIHMNLYPPKVVQEGEDMADSDFFDLQGEVHRIRDFGGKYVLLDFWSRGCGPCIASMPELKEIYAKHKDQLEIISLSVDNDKNWREASAEHKLEWSNWNDMKGFNGVFRSYSKQLAVPLFVLLSPEGKCVAKLSGYGKGALKSLVEDNIKSK